MKKEENKYISKLDEVKNLINNDFNELKKIIDSVSAPQIETKLNCEGFESFLVINKDITNHKSHEFKSIRGKACVYTFKMVDDWNVPSNFDNFYFCAKRNNFHNKIFKKDQILYAGKSYKAIERVHQHYADDESKTSSLKLGWEEREGLGKKSIMILFFLKKELNNYKSFILPLMEEKMHSDLIPLVGSPRV